MDIQASYAVDNSAYTRELRIKTVESFVVLSVRGLKCVRRYVQTGQFGEAALPKLRIQRLRYLPEAF